MKKTIIAAALFIVSAVAATAQPAYKNKNLKEENRRMERGVFTGKFTRSEAARLKAEEARLRADIYRYKRDGRLTAWERKDLAMKEAALNRNILLQKNDRQVRYY